METLNVKDLNFEARCTLIAQVVHAANRQYVEFIGGRANNPSWEELREEERQGLINAIKDLIENPKTPRASHEAWCEARKADGWKRDKVYSHHRKTHPNLVPYNELPFEEQFKDHLFMGISSIFVSGLERYKMIEFTGEPTEVVIDPEEGRDPAPPECPLPTIEEETKDTDTEKADTGNNDTLEAASAKADEQAAAPTEETAKSSTEAEAPAEDKGEKVETAEAPKKKAQPKSSK
jgi:hypothetical protein